MIGLVCDLNPDALEQVEAGGTTIVRTVHYSAANPMFEANVTYNQQPSAELDLLSLSCFIPGGDVATKIGHVELSMADWSVVASSGTELPKKLQPQNLTIPRPSSPSTALGPSSYATASSVAEDPGFAVCEAQAVDVFTRFANGQLTLTQARRQLPVGVPASTLTHSLEGVKRYESDGIPHADAVTEAGGAVGQACPH